MNKHAQPGFLGDIQREKEDIYTLSDWAETHDIPESEARAIVKHKLEKLKYTNPIAYKRLIGPLSTDDVLLAMWRKTGDPKYLTEIRRQAKWEALQAEKWAKKAELAEIGLKNEAIKDFAAEMGFLFKLAQEQKAPARKVAALLAFNMLGQFTAAVIDNDLRKVAADVPYEAVYEVDPTYEYIAKLLEEGRVPSNILIEEAIKYRKSLREPAWIRSFKEFTKHHSYKTRRIVEPVVESVIEPVAAPVVKAVGEGLK
jgi:hypothetical protein